MSGYAWMHPDDEEWQMQLDEQLERDPNSLRAPALTSEEHAAMLDVHAGDVPLVTGVFDVDETGGLHAMPRSDQQGGDALLVIEETIIGPDEVHVWPEDVELPGLAPIRWIMGGGF